MARVLVQPALVVGNQGRLHLGPGQHGIDVLDDGFAERALGAGRVANELARPLGQRQIAQRPGLQPFGQLQISRLVGQGHGHLQPAQGHHLQQIAHRGIGRDDGNARRAARWLQQLVHGGAIAAPIGHAEPPAAMGQPFLELQRAVVVDEGLQGPEFGPPHDDAGRRLRQLRQRELHEGLALRRLEEAEGAGIGRLFSASSSRLMGTSLEWCRYRGSRGCNCWLRPRLRAPWSWLGPSSMDSGRWL